MRMIVKGRVSDDSIQIAKEFARIYGMKIQASKNNIGSINEFYIVNPDIPNNAYNIAAILKLMYSSSIEFNNTRLFLKPKNSNVLFMINDGLTAEEIENLIIRCIEDK